MAATFQFSNKGLFKQYFNREINCLFYLFVGEGGEIMHYIIWKLLLIVGLVMGVIWNHQHLASLVVNFSFLVFKVDVF